MIDILSLKADELSDFLVSLGGQKYNGKQVFDWLHKRRVKSFDEMTNISKELRAKLSQSAVIYSLETVKEQRSADGTAKYLFALSDGNCIETVALRYEHGISVCVSSQAGCKMGCRFCASTGIGFARNLTASEILLQVYEVCEKQGERADSVVLMGIGEPLDNFDNVVRFCDIIADENGYNLSGRSISLSTCGLADKIEMLADLKKQLTLSVSLHAASDEKRSRTMPINDVFGISRLMKSCRYYTETTGRRISFEYAVIHGQNDTDADAKALAKLLRGMISHVNLIPVNKTGGGDYSASRDDAKAFRDKLLFLGVNATIRRTLGDDISAACGQLRRDTINHSELG